MPHRQIKATTIFSRYKKQPWVIFGIVVVVFGLIGLFTFLLRAATPSLTFELENGSVSSPAAKGNDPTASNGQYVQFQTTAPGINPPNTIASNCSADVTTAFNTWLDSLAAGTVISLPAKSCYLAQSAIRIINKNGLTIHGNGATIRRTSNNDTVARNNDNAQFNLQDCSNINMDNLVIQGPKDSKVLENTKLENQAGIGLHGCTGVVIDAVSISDVWGDFVYTGPGINLFATKNVTVKNSNFYDAGRQGIALTNADQVQIVNNTIRGAYHWIVDLEPNNIDNPVTNVTIDHNQVDQVVLPTARGFVSSGGGYSVVHDITISNNTIRGYLWVYLHATNWNDPTGIGRRKNFTITGNTAMDPTGVGFLRTDIDQGVTIGVYGIDNATIQNNTSQIALSNSTAVYTAVGLYGSKNVVSKNNKWPGALYSIGQGTADPGGDTVCSQGDSPAPAPKIAQQGICPAMASLP